jgi:hypothetical protein
MIGWNSSTGFPDGSSAMICFPPTPVTMSFRKCTPDARILSTTPARSSTSIAKRFQPPGAICAIRHPLAATRRRVRRAQDQAEIAARKHRKRGSRMHLELEAELLRVKGDRGINIPNDVSNLNGTHAPSFPYFSNTPPRSSGLALISFRLTDPRLSAKDVFPALARSASNRRTSGTSCCRAASCRRS